MGKESVQSKHAPEGSSGQDKFGLIRFLDVIP